MTKLEIFSDGACSKNPGPGGWACILKCGGKSLKLSGNEKQTTNNRMELLAVIKALQQLKRPCDVTIYTDSKYVVDSINKGWAKKWQLNGWIKSNKSKALNSDLWEELLALIEKHKTRFKWVKGHSGHLENDLCDKLAVNEYKKLSLI